jgi:hypothetical protein
MSVAIGAFNGRSWDEVRDEEIASVRKAREPEERPVVGLDLSPTATGAVWLPSGWSPGDWGAVVADTFDVEGEQRDLYQEAIAVLDFIESVWKRTPAKFPSVFYEQYAFSQGNNIRGVEQRELGGMVKFALRERHAARAHPIVASSGRKLLFGPTKKTQTGGKDGWKKFIEAELGRMGCSLGDGDQRDALVVANAGRHALGLPCLAQG